jgi:hypothetical protein
MVTTKADYLLKLAYAYVKYATMLPAETQRFHNEFNSFLADHGYPATTEAQFIKWLAANPSIASLTVPFYNNAADVNFLVAEKYNSSSGETYVYVITVSASLIKDCFKRWMPNGFEIIEQKVLNPTDGVPQLFLALAEKTNVVLSKDMSYFDFLTRTLKNWFGFTNAEINDFYIENKSSFDRIAHFINKRPQYLGGGADGDAYDIGGDLVLKLFRNRTSYEAALKAIDRLHKDPDLARTEAMIYDAGVLGSHDDEDIYYYVIQKMIPVHDKLGEYADDLLTSVSEFIGTKVSSLNRDKLRTLKHYINDPKYRPQILNEVSRLVNVIEKAVHEELLDGDASDEKLYAIQQDGQLKDNWLRLYIEEIIVKYLTSRTDLHLGNLGITNSGELRYFDPSYGNWVSKLNLGRDSYRNTES